MNPATKQRIFILIGVFGFILFLLFVVSFLLPQGAKEEKPTPGVSPIITSPPISLKIIKVHPEDFTLGAGGKIIFYFSQFLNQDSVQLRINPSVQMRISFDAGENSITIEPVTVWQVDTTYEVILDKDISSIDGDRLGEDKTYRFTVKNTATL